MAVDVHKLIAAIVPDVYCSSETRKEVKKAVKEGLAEGKEGVYLEAAKEADPIKTDIVIDYDAALKDPLSSWGLKYPYEEHEIIYDSTSESLEPLYFWLVDFVKGMGMKTEKITDNFVASPGSGHFSEMGQKATRMQEEAMKMLGAANQIVKSILNLVYDLKEFKLVLAVYEDYREGSETERNAALLSLKQRWMDMVDFAKRGTTSLKQMAAQMDYVTIIDAFMAVKSTKDIKELDLNDRVKRILLQRVPDFFHWVDESEKELKKRYEIEKKYLKSQVSTIKLYSRWIKPYLRSAKQLEQNVSSNQEALVTAFNTIILELTLMAIKSYDPKEDVSQGVLPEVFEKAKAREYKQVIFIDFKFRGIPNRVSQRGDWSFGGRTTMHFKSYSLNEKELKIFKEELERDDLGDAMRLIEGTTTESLDQIQEDIDEFLKEDNKEEKKRNERKKRKEVDINPFSALFAPLFGSIKPKKKKEEDDSMEIKKDSEYEKVIRSQAIIKARDDCFTIFDIYKRAHRMPAFENPFT